MNKKLLILGSAAVMSLGAVIGFSNNQFGKVGATKLNIDNGQLVINKDTLVERPDRPATGGYVTTAHGNKIEFYTSNSMKFGGEDYIMLFTTSSGFYLTTPLQHILGVTVNYSGNNIETARFVCNFGTYSGDFGKSQFDLAPGVEALNPNDEYTYFALWSFAELTVQSITIRYSCAY